MTKFYLTNISLMLLLSTPAAAFGPLSAPQKQNSNLPKNIDGTTDKKNNVENMSQVTASIHDINEDSELDMPFGIDEQVIRKEYDRFFGFDKTDFVERFSEFKKTFLETMEKALAQPTTSKTIDDEETSSLAASLGIEEIMIRQEYEKWLDRYNKVADETRYPQFKKNFLVQFQNDLESGVFYTLNEYGDCMEAEATTQLLNFDQWDHDLWDQTTQTGVQEESREQKFQEILKATESLEEKISKLRQVLSKPPRRSQEMKIVGVTVETIVDAQEIDSREVDASMFTQAVRKDVYTILKNPYSATQGGLSPDLWNSDDFGAALVVKKSSSGEWDTYAFVDRHTFFNEMNVEQDGYVALSNDDMIQAIDCIGNIDPLSLALTKAFEHYLSWLVQEWGDMDAASSFSIEFLAAFGRELTERFDLNSRIRSGRLTEEDLKVLSTEAFAHCVDPEVMWAFQQ